MELIAVLLMCAVTALVLYYVITRPLGSQRPRQDPAEAKPYSTNEPREKAAERGTPQSRKTPI